MDIGSILLNLGLFLLIALFIGRPLFEKGDLVTGSIEQEHSALLAERDRTISAIQELDFDHSLHKIPSGDYPEQRKALMMRGANILRQLNVFQSGDQVNEDDNTQLEEIIQSRRKELAAGGTEAPQGSPGVVSEDDEYEELIAARRRSRSEKSVGFCAQCGGPIQSSDKFCPKCGARNS
jgi:rubrerythrin